MSSSTTDIETWPSAITITQEDGKLRAVQIAKHGESFEVLLAKSSKGRDADWGRFASECGLSVWSSEQAKTDRDNVIVVGFSSAGVAFYHLDLPAVKKEETAAIVRLQAETLLPLPAEQMELTWRSRPTQDGKVAITIAAARREYLQRFVENVRVLEPEKILLDCEGIVKVWKELFSGDAKDAVIMSLATRSAQVCLAEDGRLSSSVVLDMGTEDLSEEYLEQTETIERFVQDIRSALKSFGYVGQKKLPFYVLSNGSKVLEGIVSCLKTAGLDARAALPEIEKITSQKEFGIEQLYEYRIPIGLALMALETPTEGLNLFENLYKPAGREEKKSALYSLKIAGGIAAIVLVMFVIISYVVDVASPNAIEKRLTTTDSNTDINLLMQRQKLIKAVALERPDLLELLKLVNEGGDSGVKLDSFYFKKGQLVSITGQVQNSDQLYRFQEALLSKNGIKEVKIQSTSRDSKSKRIKFTITFHYRNFTQKKTRT